MLFVRGLTRVTRTGCNRYRWVYSSLLGNDQRQLLQPCTQFRCPDHYSQEVLGCRVIYSWVSSAISTIGQQSQHQGTYVVEEQLDPFSLVADELSILTNSLRSMVIAKVLLLMATALNVPMPRPAPDAAGDPLSVELRSRQRCIAEITEMIHRTSGQRLFTICFSVLRLCLCYSSESKASTILLLHSGLLVTDYLLIKMSNSESQAFRKDPAWNYATLPDPKNTNKVKCNFCGKVTSGGIYQHKQHLVGGNRNTLSCSKCLDHVKEEINSYMSKKKEVKNQMDAIPHFDEVAEQQEYWEAEEDVRDPAKGKRPISASFGQRSNVAPDFHRKKLKQTGPIDLYFRQDVDEIVQQRKKKNAKATKLYDENKKKLRENAVQRFARWMYHAGIPFNAVNYDSLKPFIEAVGQFGCGMKPPIYHEVRVTCLKNEFEHTKLILKEYTDDHSKY